MSIKPDPAANGRRELGFGCCQGLRVHPSLPLDLSRSPPNPPTPLSTAINPVWPDLTALMNSAPLTPRLIASLIYAFDPEFTTAVLSHGLIKGWMDF